MRRNPRRRPDAFTLIELLVVVSIIALLVSILLPSLSEARESGKRTVCLTNLRQIGTAQGSYYNDYADIFPWYCDDEYRDNRRTNQSWYYGGRYPPLRPQVVNPDNIAQELRFLPEERPLNAYLYPNAEGEKADTPLFRCPSEDGFRWVGSTDFEHDPTPAYLVAGTSYTGNWHWPILGGLMDNRSGGTLQLLPDYANKMTRYKLAQRGAGIFITLYGDPLDTMLLMGMSGQSYPGWHRKLNFTECLMLDGHADYVMTDFRTGNGFPTKTVEWTLWWNCPSTSMLIPKQFLPPNYEGIEDYDDTYETP